MEKISKDTLDMIKNHRMPTYSEIPNVGLYLEQTAKYINEFLEPLMDTAVTGSMISNYVKKKLVSNPVKKQYYRDQIAKLIVIAVLKSVISLDKVNLLLEETEDGNMEKDYTSFCMGFSDALRRVFGIEEVGCLKEDERLLGSVIATVAHKIYIDKMISQLELEKAGQ